MTNEKGGAAAPAEKEEMFRTETAGGELPRSEPSTTGRQPRKRFVGKRTAAAMRAQEDAAVTGEKEKSIEDASTAVQGTSSSLSSKLPNLPNFS